MSVEGLIEDLKGVPDLLQELVDKALTDDQQDIAEINREQMLKGLGADGKPLGRYSEVTKKIREKKGLQTKHIDLKFTGKFHRNLEVSKSGEGKYELTSTDPKWEEKLEVQERFSNAVGIMEENEDKVTEVIIENIELRFNELFT